MLSFPRGWRRRLARVGLVASVVMVGGLIAQLWVRGAGTEVAVIPLEAPLVRLGSGARVQAFAASGSTLYVVEDSGFKSAVRALPGDGASREVPPSPLRRNGRIQAVAIEPDGGAVYLYDSKSKVHVLDSAGQQSGVFRVLRRPGSIAAVKNEGIAIGAPADGKLIHVFSKDGRWLRSIGAIQHFVDDEELNLHLNEGIVLAEPGGGFIYVFRNAPKPSLLRFAPDGALRVQAPINGEAIDLQLPEAIRFIEERARERAARTSCSIGSLNIVNGAALDPATGHVWVALNGSTTSGLVYEYDPNGTKLGEYRFSVADSQALDSVQGIAVESAMVYVKLADGTVRRFERPRSTAQHVLASSLARLARGWEHLGEDGMLLPVANAQLPCPDADPLNACLVTCAGGQSADCKSPLDPHQNIPGQVPYDSTCIKNGLNCEGRVRTCNASNGVRVLHTVELVCKPCNPCSAFGWTQDPNYCANPNDTDHCGCCFRDNSPIFLDMGAPGFPFSNTAAGVLFEVDGSGTVRRLGWPLKPSEEPWLVMDRNGNGEIDSLVELFGNATPLPNGTISNHGYELLAQMDDDHNGWVDRSDEGFGYLQLWRDANRNGISEPQELQRLVDTPVAGLKTGYQPSAVTDQWGNKFKYRSWVKFDQGAPRRTWDVFVVSEAP